MAQRHESAWTVCRRLVTAFPVMRISVPMTDSAPADISKELLSLSVGFQNAMQAGERHGLYPSVTGQQALDGNFKSTPEIKIP